MKKRLRDWLIWWSVYGIDCILFGGIAILLFAGFIGFLICPHALFYALGLGVACRGCPSTMPTLMIGLAVFFLYLVIGEILLAVGSYIADRANKHTLNVQGDGI